MVFMNIIFKLVKKNLNKIYKIEIFNIILFG